MATMAKTDGVARALVILLGAAVFLNYVDRGAIAVAAPLMKGELGLTATSSAPRFRLSSGSTRRCSWLSAGCATVFRFIG